MSASSISPIACPRSITTPDPVGDGFFDSSVCADDPDDCCLHPPDSTEGCVALARPNQHRRCLVNPTPNPDVTCIGPEEIRAALFTQRRPVVKPLFDQHRPVGVPFVHLDQEPPTLFERIARFFDS